MSATPHPPRPGRSRAVRADRRPVRALGTFLMIMLAVLAGTTACARTGGVPLWQDAAADAAPASPAPATPAAPTSTPGDAKVITLSATGDIVMGNVPGRLPADDGRGFFDSVTDALAADLVMGNLEEPLTDDTGTSKCGKNADDCHQFRAPPGYAAHLRDAGFMLLNQANNHGYDFGAAGYRNTQKALEKHGLQHTGAVDQITVVTVEGVTVAVVGFSPYSWNNSVTDIDAAQAIVERAAADADLVVVQVHMGAEGSEKTRVKPGTEMFLGENRGDPITFSRAVIDAGADVVIGHGPHVLRGMEFYQGRLIAYSLGNFAGGGGTLSNRAALGLGGVLKVSLTPDGEWAGGEFVSTYMNGAGKPTLDADARGLDLIRTVTRSDFPNTGPRFRDDGKISPPAA